MISCRPGSTPARRGRQQLRCPRPGRDVERHQRPVPVRRQPGEDLVELAHPARCAGSGTAPSAGKGPSARCDSGSIGLWCACARPPRRDRSSGNGLMSGPRARIQVEVVKAPQHRLRMRAHRRRIRPRPPAARRPCPPRPRPAGPLAPDLKPPAEVTGLDAGRPIPSDPCRIKEPEPAQQIHPIRADRGLRPPRRRRSRKNPAAAATTVPSGSTSRYGS